MGMRSDSMNLSAKIETCIQCSNRITMAWESVKTLEGKEQFSSLGGNSTEINGNIQRYPKAARDWNRQDQIWWRKWSFMRCLTWKWKLSVACPLFHFCFFLTLQVLKNTHVKLDMGEFSGWKKEQTIQQLYFNLKTTFTVFANELEKPKPPPNLQLCPQATSASLGNIPLLLLWCTAAIAKSKRSLLAGLVEKVRHQEPWGYKSESI